MRPSCPVSFEIHLQPRPDERGFFARRWSREEIAVVLTASNHHMLYLLEGCGHGLMPIEDETEVFYQVSEFPGSTLG
jgi:dTDP-4-dehydrorhamnose 3,5-epimerase-like enzyme